jgi:hypothetical protein
MFASFFYRFGFRNSAHYLTEVINYVFMHLKDLI